METPERSASDAGNRVAAVPCPLAPVRHALPLRPKAAAARGFTLIEILVVISIIMFLMAFVVVAAVKYSQRTRIEACKSLLQRIGIGLDRYHGREPYERLPGEPGRVYPPVDPTRKPGMGEVDRTKTANLYPYLRKLMVLQAGELRKDPGGETIIVDPWGSEVMYWARTKEVAELGNYRLYSFGPDRRYGGDDDISLKEAQY